MSIELIVALVSIAVGFVAFVPAMVGEKRVEEFGDRFKRTAQRMQHALPGFGKSVVGGLLALVVLIVGSVLAGLTDSGLPPWASEKVAREWVEIISTVLKYTGFVAAGLIGLAIAAAVVVLLLWFAARLLAAVPVGPRSLATTAFVLTVGVSVAGYVSARIAARGHCPHQTAVSARESANHHRPGDPASLAAWGRSAGRATRGLAARRGVFRASAR